MMLTDTIKRVYMPADHLSGFASVQLNYFI